MVIGFRGRWQYKMFNATKPSKYHIKTFGLCDSATGYVGDILTYFGANTSYNPDADKDGGQAVQVFDTLLQHVGTGHKIFADRFYTTRKLINYLLQKKQYYTGTLNVNRLGFPKAVKSLISQHEEMKWFLHKEKTMLCVAFKDKKAKKNVIMVSTDAEVGTAKGNDVDKPSMVDTYNRNMNGCDKLDQKVTYYCVFERKTIKWWKKLFYWLFEICQANSYILFCLSQKPGARKLSLKDYKHVLIRQLTQNVVLNEQIRAPGRQQETGCLEKTKSQHIVDYSKRDRDCVICSTSTKWLCWMLDNVCSLNFCI
uniref:PiggyBac transposable element-derived protein domain-containing protein n=1 Tax=Biomphalaria glabrata TaxID=6526 RepID=A0A2C9KFX3_BIOGL